MSSSKRRGSGVVVTRREIVTGLGAGFALTLLAGCGFQPLYGRTASGARMQDVLAAVDVNPVPGRVGQRLRNELIFDTTGGGYRQRGIYQLDIAIRESVIDQLVRTSGEARGQTYVLEAQFKLTRVDDNSIAMQGKATSRAAYDRFENGFSNVRARIDAENRAARTVAENIRTRLTAFLSSSA